MIDWFVALTPVLLVPPVLLLLFVGCGLDVMGQAPPQPPPPPPPPPPAPPPGPGPGPPPGGPPPPPVVLAVTRFQLNLSPMLQFPTPAPQVWKVDVTWTLKQAGVAVGKIPSPPLHFEPKDPSRKNLEFGVDEWAQHIDVAPALLGSADSVACTCEITLSDGSTSVATSAAPDTPLIKQSCQLYRLAQSVPVPTFIVTPESPDGC